MIHNRPISYLLHEQDVSYLIKSHLRLFSIIAFAKENKHSKHKIIPEIIKLSLSQVVIKSQCS